MTRESFDRFCETEWPRLVGTLVLHCGDLAVAEELTQEALVRVYARWRRVQRLDSPGGFAHRVAINLARSHWRRLGAEQRAHARMPEPSLEVDHADGVALRDALGRLPDPQKEAIILRFWAGMSAGEAGSVMGMTPGAFRVLTHRAVTRLRQEFGQPQVTHESEA